MGMAASQARLLTITARQHDVEYKAQSIQEAKLRLATQQDEVYQEYLAALDATTLTVKDWEGNVKTATFNNLCGPNAIEIATGNQYVFRDSRGALIVPDEVKNTYEKYKQSGGASDPYLFAYYALGLDGDEFIEKIKEAENSVLEKYESLYINNNIQEILQNAFKYFCTQVGLESTDSAYQDYSPRDLGLHGGVEDIFNAWMNDEFNGVDLSNDPEMLKYKSLAKGNAETISYNLYKSHSQEIWETAGLGNEIDQTQFDYYVKWFRAIEAEGGFCTSINDYNSTLPGNEDTRVSAANDSEWLQNMIKCGKITVDLLNTDKKTGAVSFSSTGVPSDSILEYTTTTTIDKSAMAKAEAEYEHKNRQINQKDKQFDMDLSKLDTERSALAKQYDSLTKVIDDNIERTFGIFS